MPSKQEILTLEGFAHALFHFLGVAALFMIVVCAPIWLIVLALIIEYLQIKLLGNCIMTKLAHHRGFMLEMSYWEYIPYLLGVKNYQLAKVIIDNSIKAALVGMLIFRILIK